MRFFDNYLRSRIGRRISLRFKLVEAVGIAHMREKKLHTVVVKGFVDIFGKAVVRGYNADALVPAIDRADGYDCVYNHEHHQNGDSNRTLLFRYFFYLLGNKRINITQPDQAEKATEQRAQQAGSAADIERPIALITRDRAEEGLLCP